MVKSTHWCCRRPDFFPARVKGKSGRCEELRGVGLSERGKAGWRERDRKGFRLVSMRQFIAESPDES